VRAREFPVAARRLPRTTDTVVGLIRSPDGAADADGPGTPYRRGIVSVEPRSADGAGPAGRGQTAVGEARCGHPSGSGGWRAGSGRGNVAVLRRDAQAGSRTARGPVVRTTGQSLTQAQRSVAHRRPWVRVGGAGAPCRQVGAHAQPTDPARGTQRVLGWAGLPGRGRRRGECDADRGQAHASAAIGEEAIVAHAHEAVTGARAAGSGVAARRPWGSRPCAGRRRHRPCKTGPPWRRRRRAVVGRAKAQRCPTILGCSGADGGCRAHPVPYLPGWIPWVRCRRNPHRTATPANRRTDATRAAATAPGAVWPRRDRCTGRVSGRSGKIQDLRHHPARMNPGIPRDIRRDRVDIIQGLEGRRLRTISLAPRLFRRSALRWQWNSQSVLNVAWRRCPPWHLRRCQGHYPAPKHIAQSERTGRASCRRRTVDWGDGGTPT